jgi:hypothetical protein
MASKNLVVDQCPLCRRRDILKLSHIIPRGVYRRVSMNGLSVNIVGGNATLTQSQLRTALLCEDCEQKLNKNGERYFLLNCLQSDASFPLLDRASLASHALPRDIKRSLRG